MKERGVRVLIQLKCSLEPAGNERGCDASVVCCTAELTETYRLLSSVPLAFLKAELTVQKLSGTCYSEIFFYAFLLKTLSRVCQHAGSHKHVKLFGSGK